MTGGVGNLTNTGKIYGAVAVSGPAGATLYNNGNITGLIPPTDTLGYVRVSSDASNTASANSYIATSSFMDSAAFSATQVQALDGGGNVIATTYGSANTQLFSGSSSSSGSSSQTTIAAGTNASLFNDTKGRIGTGSNTQTINITVSADQNATATNSGLIWATSVDVVAKGFSNSTSNSWSNIGTSTDARSDSSTTISTPGNAYTSYLQTSTHAELLGVDDGHLNHLRVLEHLARRQCQPCQQHQRRDDCRESRCSWRRDGILRQFGRHRA